MYEEGNSSMDYCKYKHCYKHMSILNTCEKQSFLDAKYIKEIK